MLLFVLKISRIKGSMYVFVCVFDMSDCFVFVSLFGDYIRISILPLVIMHGEIYRDIQKSKCVCVCERDINFIWKIKDAFG